MSLHGMTPRLTATIQGESRKQRVSYRENAIKRLQSQQNILSLPETTPKSSPTPRQG